MRILTWGLGLFLGIIIYAVLAVSNPFFNNFIFMCGIPLVFAGFGGFIGDRIKKNMEIEKKVAKEEEARKNNKKNKAKQHRSKRKIGFDQLSEEQLKQIDQLVAKDEKYQAAKRLSEITDMSLNESIDAITAKYKK